MEPQEKFEALWLKAGLHKRPGADALLYDLEKQGFFDLPASIKHHSNRFGGLATHTVNVADAAMELCETNHAFKDCDKNAVLVAALLHDICNPIWLILQGRYTQRQCGGLLCDAGRISCW